MRRPSSLLEFDHKKKFDSPVGVEFNNGEENSKKNGPEVPLQCFSRRKRETEDLKNLADLKPLFLSLCISLARSDTRQKKTEGTTKTRSLLFPNFTLYLSVPRLSVIRVLVCVAPWRPAGGALLRGLAQLYLLLDGTSRVVDERVDQTRHCKYTADDGANTC